ncbi:guanine nucleotide exchange factor [Suillus lakei]|nr:guanine nucleotide exchange factor [Suillus lakei]
MSLLQAYSSLSSSSPKSTISTKHFHQLLACNSFQLILDDRQAVIIDDSPGRFIRGPGCALISGDALVGKIPHGAQVLASVPNLNCVANTLLLSEPARTRLLSQDIDGGNICVDLLQNTFLSSRILFLCTASPNQSASFIESIVETKRTHFPGNGTIIDVVALKLDDLIASMQSGIKMSRDAMTDLLKLTFNLLVHYPKLAPSEVQSPALVMGDFWNSRLDGFSHGVAASLPPLVRAFQTIPLSSPKSSCIAVDSIIHSLITIPVDASSRAIWFGTRSTFTFDYHHSPVPPSPPLFFGWLSHDNQPRPRSQRLGILSVLYRPSFQPVAVRSVALPRDIDPDDPAVRDLCKIDGDTSLDEIVCPLVLLITRFCLGDDDAKTRIRRWLVPENLDRTHPLEKRADLLGRCLRLLASVYHSRLKDSMGEMLYAMCDSDATTLAGYFGYGNVAGFLFHKGVVSAPPVSTASGAPPTTASGLPINPITGTVEHPSEAVDMTDEEKEHEAEKLFVLFDRLEKTGALPPSQNPYRKAFQEGKMG